jgi:hypothetical protein
MRRDVMMSRAEQAIRTGRNTEIGVVKDLWLCIRHRRRIGVAVYWQLRLTA